MRADHRTRATRRARRWAWLGVCLCVALLVGLASAPAAAPAGARKTTTTVATPKEWDPRLAPIADRVAKLRGLKFDHPVAAEFLDDAAFDKRVTVDKGKLSKADQADIERSQGQLRAVGLIGADVDLVDATSSLQTSGVLAYYSPKTKKITVKGTSTDDISTRVTVAHELTHALQDQHFDLRKLQKDAAEAHASTPLRTLVEGDAVRIQNAYVQSLPRSDQTAYDEQRASEGAQAQTEIAAKDVPESLTVFFEAPYDLGPTMLTALIAKEKVAGVDALFEHPPTADATFLTPSTLLEHRVFPEVPPPKLAKGERRSGPADVFGAFALYQVLASRVEPGLALAAADAWGGDSMVTFTRGGTTCLRSTFLGKTPDGIATIGDALSQWASQMPAGAAEVDRTGRRVTLTACDPGAGSTEAPNRALASLVFVASRDGLFSELVQQDYPVKVAVCTSDALVRDPAFQPVLDQAATDPSAVPDAEVISGVRSRVQGILRECQSTET